MPGALEDRRLAVVQAVRDGAVTKARVELVVRGDCRRARAEVAGALAEGQIHPTVAYFPVRDGHVRSGPGLGYGPGASSRAPAMTGDQLRELRLGRGLSQADLAARLSPPATAGLVKHWESGRQPIALRYQEQLPDALARAKDPPSRVTEHRQLVLHTLELHGPLTLTELLRRVGKQATTRRVLAALVDEHQAHETVTYLAPSGCRGGRRSCRAFAAGRPRGAATVVPSSSLRAARSRVGWSQAQVAAELGVAESVVGRWERDCDTIPGWAAAAADRLVRRLRRLPSAVEAAAELVVATVADQPHGVSRKRLRHILDRHDETLAAGVGLALRRGLVHEDETGCRGGRRRLYAGPAVPPLSPAELVERRCALGWTHRELAELTGIDQGLLATYELGRPIPYRHRGPLLECFVAGERGSLPRGRPRRSRRREMAAVNERAAQPYRREVLDELRRDGPATRTALAKAVGRDVLDGWLRRGLVHEQQRLVTDGRGFRRVEKVIAWGQGRPAPAMTGRLLGALRRRAGLSRPQLSQMLGRSPDGASLWAWEQRSEEAIPPAWAAEIRSVLAQLPPAPPREERPQLSDAQVERLLLDALVAEPGLSATELTGRAGGDINRRWRILRRLEAEGRVWSRLESRVDTSGKFKGRRSQTHARYYLRGR